MKTFISILFLFAVLTVSAQNQYYGSFNGIGVGLNNSLGDSNANAYLNAAGVTDQAAQSDLTGFVQELKQSGAWTNLVDAVFFNPRFNPSNNYSLKLQKWTGSNFVTSRWGMLLSGTNQVQLPITPTTSNTLVYVYRCPLTMSSNVWICGLVDTNTTSANWVYQQAASPNYEVWQRSGTTYPYSGNLNNYSNLVHCYVVDSTYSYSEGSGRVNQRTVAAVTSDGAGNVQYWQDSIQAKINLSNPVFTYNSPVTNTAAVNLVCIGGDYTNGAYAANFGGYVGEIAAVLVFNCASNTTVINSSYKALRWLEPDPVERIWVGDSLMAANAQATNCFPTLFQNAHPENICWKNIAIGGTKGQGFTTYPTNLLSNLPYPAKVKNIYFYYGFGINDIYGNGTGFPAMVQIVTNEIAKWTPLGAQFVFLNVQHLWTGASSPYAYTLAYEAVISNLDMYFYTNGISTNGFCTQVIPRDQIMNQALLNTNNGFSTDGLHYFGTNGPLCTKAIADYMLGYPYVVGNSMPSASWPNGPFDAYGNVWLNNSYPSTNTLSVSAGSGLTNTTAVNYTISITAGTAMTMKDQNGSSIFTPILNGCYPFKPGWRFTGTTVTAIAVQQ